MKKIPKEIKNKAEKYGTTYERDKFIDSAMFGYRVKEDELKACKEDVKMLKQKIEDQLKTAYLIGFI